MTALLFSNFDIPASALLVSPEHLPHEDHAIGNLIGGERWNLFRLNETAKDSFGADQFDTSFIFDLGDGNTKAVDHLIIARADMLQALSLSGRVDLTGGSDGVTFGTTALSDTSFDTATLYGPRSHDYISELSVSTACRYWKYFVDANTTTIFCHSKISFGRALDLGKDPDFYTIDRVPAKDATWYADSGAAYQVRIDEGIYRATFEWVNLTASVINSFMSTIGRYGTQNPFFLYTSAADAQHHLLDDARVLHARLVPGTAKATRRSGAYWKLEATFEEVLG